MALALFVTGASAFAPPSMALMPQRPAVVRAASPLMKSEADMLFDDAIGLVPQALTLATFGVIFLDGVHSPVPAIS